MSASKVNFAFLSPLTKIGSILVAYTLQSFPRLIYTTSTSTHASFYLYPLPFKFCTSK